MMIAASISEDAPRDASRALDAPVAALAGLAVAFLAFAAPADLLARLVAASGIDGWLALAEPPLGMKARLAIGAAGAVLVFALAFLLLRWLGRLGGSQAAEASVREAPPRPRRRDFHPDSPPRAPLSARDLGEPAPELLLPSEPRAAPDEEEPLVAEMLAEPAEPAPPAPVAPERDPSLAELIERLERGIERRRGISPPAPAPRARPAEAAGDPRLQNAIDSLQRLAARLD